MDVESYKTKKISDEAYQFFSDGKQGRYRMLIDIAPMSYEKRLYNLGFGVWETDKNQIDDTIEVNNGDTNTILSTVGMTAIAFLERNPNANLMATGSVLKDRLRARTRLYQRGINKYYVEITEKHNIYGLIADRDEKGEIIGNYPNWPGKWYPFEKGTNYDAFLLNLKKPVS